MTEPSLNETDREHCAHCGTALDRRQSVTFNGGPGGAQTADEYGCPNCNRYGAVVNGGVNRVGAVADGGQP